MKVLWFSNTPGLANGYLKGKSFGGGWIDALQLGVEAVDDCDLGFVFYTDRSMDSFKYGRTSYFPVQRTLNSKLKRLWARILTKVEYEENMNSFLNIIEEFKPDVIHVHGTESPFGLITKRVKDVPVAISIQGNLNVLAKKYFSGIAYSSIANSWSSLLNKTTQDFRIFRKKAVIEVEILRNTKYVFGRTDWDKRISRVLAPQSKYFVIDEVMRPCFYNRQWSVKKKEVVRIFTTSSNSLYKGFEVIVKTAALLKKKNFSFEWTVAGLNLQDELVQLSIRQQSIASLESTGIKLLGMINAETILDKMLDADLYVQVSHIENSPNSVCEAMLLGMPVIASNVGGTSSLIDDNETGILFQDGNSVALAGKIIEISNQKTFAESLGKAAYKVAHERHDQKRIVSKLMDAYSEVISIHN